MKKWIFILPLILLFSACTEEVASNNNKAFQGLKNNVFWRAQSYNAFTNENGNLIIEGVLGSEKITLQTASSTPQTYILGVDDVSKAIYSKTDAANTLSFTTAKNIGSGQITITEFNAQNNTISGTFKFDVLNSHTIDKENSQVIFTEGVFYKVPITAAPEF